MKTLRFAIAAAAVAGSVSAFATNARVESMGKTSMFIMDDISIFDNPANISLYPNFLIGELGNYTDPEVEGVGTGTNHDPWQPWFGGIFSLNLSADNSISIAGVMNRRDERLLKYFPTYITASPTATVSSGYTIKTPTPVTNFDGFLGANLGKTAWGLHIYVAHQDGLSDNGEVSPESFASALQADFGTNIEISNNYSLEISFGSARLQYGPDRHDFFDKDLMSYIANARMFSKLPAINGHLIPVAFFRDMNAPGRSEMDVGGGMGVDAAFDRGFFWLGLTGFYNIQKAGSNWEKTPSTGETLFRALNDDGWGDGDVTRLWQIGGTISFGIERNIWWDWFVIRVGGQKTIAYADYKAATSFGSKNNSILCPSTVSGCDIDGNYFTTNPVNDGTREDNVGFGFGINIEERLKIDATVAEDFVFRNPFQGGGRILSRISATYSF